MEYTRGSFLKEKMQNLARWVSKEVGAQEFDVDLEHFARDRTAVELSYLAEILNDNKHIIHHHDWYGLGSLVHGSEVPRNFAGVFSSILYHVQKREEMHDKWWRYLKLFTDVVNSDE